LSTDRSDNASPNASNLPGQDAEEAPAANESFMSHLVELRTRLLRAVGTVVAVFVVLFIYPGASVIYDILAAPMLASLPQALG
jgi:sec-independent protein translocase protein TatC